MPFSGGHFGWLEILLILAIVVLLFGVGRITKIGSELGKGINAFKKGLKGEDEGEEKKKDEEKDEEKKDQTNEPS